MKKKHFFFKQISKQRAGFSIRNSLDERLSICQFIAKSKIFVQFAFYLYRKQLKKTFKNEKKKRGKFRNNLEGIDK